MIASGAVVDKTSEIHESAVIEDGAFIGKNCVIGPNVSVGRNAVIEMCTTLGEECIVSPNAHVGGAPQDISYRGEDTRLEIGANCVIREFATLHRASTKEDWVTRVGNDCYIMAYSHVAHDTQLGNNVIMTSYSCTAGHVRVGDFVNFGGYGGVHQFVRIGSMCMIGNRTTVLKDLPPFCLAYGAEAGISGLNAVGLKRRGVSPEARRELKRALHIYRDLKNSLSDVIKMLGELEQYDEIKQFIEFIQSDSKRSLIRR
ncbi:acyl-ACP--UDP-N-acetylglucosamine O-acyltransferase [Limisalsivibrio acetivorans]|uniref:acyl-ACP--UDP-N-acetylglucosamine O-acyltransferase n=1 Tax=Limisalsivibrio acetivorans TaxID=1304888 RepID=UPI0003B3CB8B|nr:acyl-ACP--UDP-N-acetylglucosamine O-acyltransferase [Limisalsivibrio acetivorans]